MVIPMNKREKPIMGAAMQEPKTRNNGNNNCISTIIRK